MRLIHNQNIPPRFNRLASPAFPLREQINTRDHQLIILDNFEQLLPAAPTLADLLQSAPHLHLLVTSRAPLRLRIEQEFPVAPLQPAEAIDLFVARGRHADRTRHADGRLAVHLHELR